MLSQRVAYRIQQVPLIPCRFHPSQRRCQSVSTPDLRAGTGRVVRENDVILLRGDTANNHSRVKTYFVTPPLKPDTTFKTMQGGKVTGSDIIGRRIRSQIQDSKLRRFNLLEVSLGTYCTETPRRVTPLYPKHSVTLTSMLDLTLPRPGEDPDFDEMPPFEILEAGTGHGALTLHLARALHGANPSIPADIRDELVTAKYYAPPKITYPLPREENGLDGEEEVDTSSTPSDSQPSFLSTEKADLLKQKLERFRKPDPQFAPLPSDITLEPLDPHTMALSLSAREALASYLPSRRAILHTFDISAINQRHAHKNIRSFRRALYLPNIDFHTGSLTSYLSTRLSQSKSQPFLAHCVLDLPSPHTVGVAEGIGPALLPGGFMLVFCPNVTQIIEMAEAIRNKGAALQLERVVEMDGGTRGTGSSILGDVDVGAGRDWDVRAVRVREDTGGFETTGKEENGVWRYLCRPKMGYVVMAGGFVGVFRKFNRKGDGVAPLDEGVDVDVGEVSGRSGKQEGFVGDEETAPSANLKEDVEVGDTMTRGTKIQMLKGCGRGVELCNDGDHERPTRRSYQDDLSSRAALYTSYHI